MIIASRGLNEALSNFVDSARNVLESKTTAGKSFSLDIGPNNLHFVQACRNEMQELYKDVRNRYRVAVSEFRGSLYHQKHAFYFSAVSKWEECFKVRCCLLIVKNKYIKFLQDGYLMNDGEN